MCFVCVFQVSKCEKFGYGMMVTQVAATADVFCVFVFQVSKCEKFGYGMMVTQVAATADVFCVCVLGEQV